MRMFSLVWHRRLYQFLQTIIFIYFLTGLPAAVLAQAPPPEFKATLSGWQATFNKAAGRLSRGGLDDAEYEDLRAELASLSGEARRISAGMSDELRDNQQLADALGAPPRRGRASKNHQAVSRRPPAPGRGSSRTSTVTAGKPN